MKIKRGKELICVLLGHEFNTKIECTCMLHGGEFGRERVCSRCGVVEQLGDTECPKCLELAKVEVVDE